MGEVVQFPKRRIEPPEPQRRALIPALGMPFQYGAEQAGNCKPKGRKQNDRNTRRTRCTPPCDIW